MIQADHRAGSAFALEAWIAPNSLNNKQIVVQKPGSYALYVNTLGQVCLTLTITQNGQTYYDPPIVFDYSIKAAIAAGQASYVAVNFASGTVDNKLVLKAVK